MGKLDVFLIPPAKPLNRSAFSKGTYYAQITQGENPKLGFKVSVKAAHSSSNLGGVGFGFSQSPVLLTNE